MFRDFLPTVSRVRFCFLLGAGFVAAAGGAGQERADVAITGARVIGPAGTISDGMTILIDGDRIRTVTAETVDFSARITINAQGTWIIPGLIDTHVHLIDVFEVRDDASLAAFIHVRLPGILRDFLSHGVTTIKSSGDPLAAMIDLRSRLTRGVLQGPRLFFSGPMISVTGGHPQMTILTDNAWFQRHGWLSADYPEAARARVRDLARRGVDAIKFVYHGRIESGPEVLIDGVPVRRMPRDVMTALVEEGRSLGLRVTAHTWHPDAAMEALRAGVHGLEHGVAGQDISRQFARLLRESGADYAPTLHVISEVYPALIGRALRNTRALAQSGVPIVLGSDTFGPAAPGLSTVREAELMAHAGMKPAQILDAATRAAAVRLGKDDELGTIEPGKLADLVILEANPLADISALHRIRIVIKGGEVLVDRRQPQHPQYDAIFRRTVP